MVAAATDTIQTLKMPLDIKRQKKNGAHVITNQSA